MGTFALKAKIPLALGLGLRLGLSLALPRAERNTGYGRCPPSQLRPAQAARMRRPSLALLALGLGLALSPSLGYRRSPPTIMALQ